MHPGKLEFFLFRMFEGKRLLVEMEVPGFDAVTSRVIPQVVGIPLFGDVLTKDLLWKLC